MSYNNLHSTSYSRGGGNVFQGRGGSTHRGGTHKRQWALDRNQGGSGRHRKPDHGGTPQQFGSQGGGQLQGGWIGWRGGKTNPRDDRGNHNNGRQNHSQNQRKGQNYNGYNNRSRPSHGRGRSGRGGFGGAGASRGGPQQNHCNNPFAPSNGFKNSFNTSPNVVHGGLSGVSNGSYGGRGGHGNFSKANHFQNSQDGSQSNGTQNPFRTPPSAAYGDMSALNYENGGSRDGHGGGGTLSNANNFHNGSQGTQKQHGKFSERGRGRNRDRSKGGGGRYSTPSINPFHQSTRPGNLEEIGYDNYDADASSDTDNEWSTVQPYQRSWPVMNPLKQMASRLDSVLFWLINNTPQYRSTSRRFMDGYTGPEDLEFWMNTLGVEYMNWEVLYEVDRLGLQLPPGWDCIGREFEEQRMEANYSTQYLGGAPTEDINFRRPVSSSYSFRSERHGGTFATPAAALSMINSNPNPPLAIPAAQKAALPGTQTAFVWGRQGQEPHPAPVIVPPTTMSQRQISPADTYRFGA